MKNNQKLYLNRFLIFVFAIGLLFITMQFMKRISPFEVEQLLAPDHSMRLAYEEYKKKFNDENTAFILIQKDKVFTNRELFLLNSEIKKVIQRSPFMFGFLGLENAQYFVYEKDRVRLKLFIKDYKMEEEAKDQLGTELWKNTLIDEEMKNVLVSFRFSSKLKKKDEYSVVKGLMSDVNSIVSGFPGLETYFLGAKIANFYFFVEMFRNQTVITPLLLLIIGLFFFYLFRSFRIVMWSYLVMILSYASIIISIIAVEGGLGPYSGFALMFVFIVATSDLIHFFTSLGNAQEGSLQKRIRWAKSEVFKPCLLTSLTTCLGFMSLTLNENLPVRYFGLYCSLGSLVCFFMTFYFLPWVLVNFNFVQKYPPQFKKLNSSGLWNFIEKRGMFVFSSSIALLFLLVWNTQYVKIDDNFYGKFLKDHPLSVSIDKFSEAFNFVGSIDVIVKPKKNKIMNPQNLEAQRVFHEELKKIEAVSHVKSFPLIIDRLTKEIEMGGNKKDVEQKEEIVDSIFRMFNDFGLFADVYNDYRNEARFAIFMKSFNSELLEKTILQIKKLSNRAEFNNYLHIEPQGFSVIRSYINSNVIDNFIKSFALSLFFIFLVFCGLFRSLKWATAAMLPNIFPVFFISGLMGLFNITMESNLVILVCITLGIGVDDTIHFVHHFKNKLNAGGDYEEAVKTALNHTSQALVATTLAIVVSFPVFFVSDLKLFIQIGAFLLLSLVVALIADFLFLPSLVLFFHRKFGESKSV